MRILFIHKNHQFRLFVQGIIAKLQRPRKTDQLNLSQTARHSQNLRQFVGLCFYIPRIPLWCQGNVIIVSFQSFVRFLDDSQALNSLCILKDQVSEESAQWDSFQAREFVLLQLQNAVVHFSSLSVTFADEAIDNIHATLNPNISKTVQVSNDGGIEFWPVKDSPRLVV